jgi:coenzyme Q-binding protein COQ10
MAKLERSIIINAPVDKVFSYLTEPENRTEWLPGTTDVRNVTGHGLGQQWGYTYKIAGRYLKGKIEVTDYITNQRYAHKSTGGVVSTWTYTFNTEAGGTKLVLEVELHETPIPVIGKLFKGMVQKRSERQADAAIINIKTRLEK